MTKEQNPIALPSPELRAKWSIEAPCNRDAGISREDYLIDRAAEWGANQELEACFSRQALLYGNRAADELRAARRPKPSSLKQQALRAMGAPTKVGRAHVIEHRDHELILRALKALPDD